MLFVKDHSTGLLFDRWSHIGQKRRKLLDQGWPGVFRNYLLNALPVNRIAFRFTERTRRPSKEAHLLLGSLILQQVHDLSEDDIQRAVAFNLEYQYALNTLDGSDASIYISKRTFRNYRRIVEEEELALEIFGTRTDCLMRAFGVDPSRQRLDSTHILSNMRKLGRIWTFTPVSLPAALKDMCRSACVKPKKQRLIAAFPRKTCHACPRRRDCPVKLEKKAAYLRYDLPSLRCAVRRAEEHSPQFWEEYRWRAGIEGTNSHLKSDLGMGRLRVRGMEAVRLAVMMKVLGLNILRCGRALKARLCDSLAQFTGIFAPKSYPYACIDKLYSRIFGILKNFTLSSQKNFRDLNIEISFLPYYLS